jgi:hypothetical protein
MYKHLSLVIVLLIFSTVILGQIAKCDTIAWEEKTKLKWSDFKGLPDTSLSYKAVSSPGIGYKARLVGDTLTLEIHCSFYTCKSWTKLDSRSLLQHEQTHFDISEYYRRIFVQKILATRLTKANALEMIRNIYKNIQKLRDELDAQYDNETNFSKNNIMQVKWTNEITIRINKSKALHKKKIVIPLN